jgi:hypothetical protein
MAAARHPREAVNDGGTRGVHRDMRVRIISSFIVVVAVAACGGSSEPVANGDSNPSSPTTPGAPADDPSGGPVLVAPKDTGAKKIFVTNEIFTGNLGGLLGADAKCQGEADAAGLSGKYRAWVSVFGRSAAARLWDEDAGPYVLVTGEVVAKDFRALVSGQIEHAIDRTPKGLEPRPSLGETGCGGNLVWTSTRKDGNYAGSDCNGWTSDAVVENDWPSLGIAGATSSQWTEWCFGPKCNFEAHLYCVEE